MTLRQVEQLRVYYEPEQGRRQLVGRLARRGREVLFEYDTEFLRSRLELSPFKVPLVPGVVTGDPRLFGGLLGVFDDSLPDGWGRLLLDRRLAQEGLSPAVLGPLDRLAWVGSRGMGALVYEPEHQLDAPTVIDLKAVADETAAILDDVEAPELERLIALGGSPQGARPKALVQVSPNGKTVLYGAAELDPQFVPYLVKFNAKGDDAYAGLLEHAYAKMAAAAGLNVVATRMLGSTARHPGYFASQRFDRLGTRRIHVHTLCGIMHAPHTHPSLTYGELLDVTRDLTRDDAAVVEMFRRACFNVFAHNRDDHTKNFAFLMHADGTWQPSPAYDLTFSHGPGGEHTLLVGTEGKNPTRAHLEALAKGAAIKHASDVIDQVREAVNEFGTFADEVKLPAKLRSSVARTLGVAARRGRHPLNELKQLAGKVDIEVDTTRSRRRPTNKRR